MSPYGDYGKPKMWLPGGGKVCYNQRKVIENDEEDYIPITDHDDTNMHMGEISYDTYRLDIDPKYFEQTSVIPQPESIYDENGNVPWKKEMYGEEIAEEQIIKEELPSEKEKTARALLKPSLRKHKRHCFKSSMK